MNTLKAVIALLPQIVAAVRTIEDSVNIPKVGAQKLELLLDIIEATYEEAQVVKAAVVRVANAVVKFFNAVGVFKKSS